MRSRRRCSAERPSDLGRHRVTAYPVTTVPALVRPGVAIRPLDLERRSITNHYSIFLSEGLGALPEELDGAELGYDTDRALPLEWTSCAPLASIIHIDVGLHVIRHEPSIRP